jgi:hypothetical protein
MRIDPQALPALELRDFKAQGLARTVPAKGFKEMISPF